MRRERRRRRSRASCERGSPASTSSSSELAGARRHGAGGGARAAAQARRAARRRDRASATRRASPRSWSGPPTASTSRRSWCGCAATPTSSAAALAGERRGRRRPAPRVPAPGDARARRTPSARRRADAPVAHLRGGPQDRARAHPRAGAECRVGRSRARRAPAFRRRSACSTSATATSSPRPRVIAIVSPQSSPMRRLREEAGERGKLVDATQGRRTRSILVTDSDHVMLSAHQPGDDRGAPRAGRAKARARPERRCRGGASPSWSRRPRAPARRPSAARSSRRDPGLRFSISHTTRPPRAGERDGDRLPLREPRALRRAGRGGRLPRARRVRRATSTARAWAAIDGPLAAGDRPAARDRGAGRAPGARAPRRRAPGVPAAARASRRSRRGCAGAGATRPEAMRARLELARRELAAGELLRLRDRERRGRRAASPRCAR